MVVPRAPVVPKQQASIWNNSTFDSPDLMRKPLDSTGTQ